MNESGHICFPVSERGRRTKLVRALSFKQSLVPLIVGIGLKVSGFGVGTATRGGLSKGIISDHAKWDIGKAITRDPF